MHVQTIPFLNQDVKLSGEYTTSKRPTRLDPAASQIKFHKTQVR